MRLISPVRILWFQVLSVRLSNPCWLRQEPLYRKNLTSSAHRLKSAFTARRKPKRAAAAAAVLQEFDRLHREFHAWKPGPLMALNATIARGERHQYRRNWRLRFAMRPAIRGLRRLIQSRDRPIDCLVGFQNDEFKPVQPDPKIAALVRLAAHADLTVDVDNFVSSRNPAVQLDFGGYAKGLALDNARGFYGRQGVRMRW